MAMITEREAFAWVVSVQSPEDAEILEEAITQARAQLPRVYTADAVFRADTDGEIEAQSFIPGSLISCCKLKTCHAGYHAYLSRVISRLFLCHDQFTVERVEWLRSAIGDAFPSEHPTCSRAELMVAALARGSILEES